MTSIGNFDHLRRARELHQSGDLDAALQELYLVLWGDTFDPEVHFLLWDILECQRLEQERVTRLRGAIDNPLTGVKKGRPGGARGDDDGFATPREVPRFSSGKPVILVGHDVRNRLFGELVTIEIVSIKGASLALRHQLQNGDQVHLFPPHAEDDDFMVALVRNIRIESDGRHRVGIEFLRKPRPWLLPEGPEPPTS